MTLRETAEKAAEEILRKSELATRADRNGRDRGGKGERLTCNRSLCIRCCAKSTRLVCLHTQKLQTHWPHRTTKKRQVNVEQARDETSNSF